MKIAKHQTGFTLIEVLIAAALTGILGIGIVSMQYILSQTQVETYKNIINIEEANSSISTLVREVRNIRTADNGAYPIETANDQEMVFYSDIDFDGETEKVSYQLQGSTFTKGVIEPTGFPVTYPQANQKTKTITANARNGALPVFYYYNGDWPTDTINNPLPAPVRLSETKLMRLYLELNTNDSENEDNFVLESYVQIRMLKENL